MYRLKALRAASILIIGAFRWIEKNTLQLQHALVRQGSWDGDERKLFDIAFQTFVEASSLQNA